MEQVDRREQLLAAMHSSNDDATVEAVKGLLAIREYGMPAGAYLLAGGKAAFRSGRLADAVVLLFHGLRVAEPRTMLWAEMLVQRAMACSHHGFWLDALDAANTYLETLPQLPAEATKWAPFAHHALGLSYDRLQRYSEAVPHHRYALDLYTDPARRTHAACDLAYSLALSGHAADGDQVLAQVDRETLSGIAEFGYWCTTALIRYCQGRYAESLRAAEQAEASASGHEESWAVPLAELNYWRSRAAWELGDRCGAAARALRCAIVADQRWHLALRDTANEWLTEMMRQGGITSA